MPPATPQKGGGDASMGPPVSSVSRAPRRSFAPGANVSIFAESPNRGPRKSVAPRMSTMPSAANKLCSNGQIVPNMPVAVSYSEYQAVKAESNRLRLDVERVTERLEDERAHRQKKEDEAIALSKKVHELEQKLAKYARQAGRAERLAKRGEEEKVKGELSLKHALNDAVGDKEAKEERLQQLSRRFEESERALAAARFSEEELTAANEALEARLSTASADVADARKKLEQAEGAREGVRRTLDDHKAEAEAHQKSLTDTVQHLTEDLDELREENAEALAQLAELGAVREGLSTQLETAEADLLAERAALGQVRREVEALAPVAARAEVLEKTLDEKEEEAAGLTAALAQRDEAAARLKAEVLAARQAATDAAAEGRLRADDVRELQSAKEALEERAEELQREVKEAQAGAAEARCQDRQQRVESSTEHTRLLKQQEEHKELIRDQKAKLASQERRAKKLASDADAAARAMAAKEGELEGLEEKLAELDYQVKVEAHKAKKQQLIADRLREKMEVKEGEIRKLRQSKKALIETANERIDKMNAETKKLENVSNNYRYGKKRRERNRITKSCAIYKENKQNDNIHTQERIRAARSPLHPLQAAQVLGSLRVLRRGCRRHLLRKRRHSAEGRHRRRRRRRRHRC